MLRRLILMLIVFIIFVAALGAWKFVSVKQQIAQFKAPKPPIQIAAEEAQTLAWQSRLPAIGTLTARQGIELTAEISGTVAQVLFEPGQQVSVGQKLLVMRSEVEQASLSTAQAQAALAELNFTRQQSLLQRQHISQAEFDQTRSTLKQAQAKVEELRALLDKKTINAPFSGKIGITDIDSGDYLSPGAPIATLQDLSNLYVDFTLAERYYRHLSVGERIELRVAAFEDQRFSGEITAINPQVDISTRTIKLRAKVDNPDEQLLPGMFAELEVLLPDIQQRTVIPETAVNFTLYGNSIYVIQPAADTASPSAQPTDNAEDTGEPPLQVERRFVTTGERRGGKVVILEGLSTGEQVVTAGQLKLSNGSAIVINNSNPL